MSGAESQLGAGSIMLDASCAVLARDGEHGLELLLAQRSFDASFAPGAWVFPGGVLEPHDADAIPGADPLRVAAIRECLEEIGVIPGLPGLRLEAREAVTDGALVSDWGVDQALVDRMVFCDHWITPPPRPKRFSTRFYVCPHPSSVSNNEDSQADGVEILKSQWWRPSAALKAFEQKQIRLFFPQRVQLAKFEEYADVAALMAWANGLETVPVIAPGQPTP